MGSSLRAAFFVSKPVSTASCRRKAPPPELEREAEMPAKAFNAQFDIEARPEEKHASSPGGLFHG